MNTVLICDALQLRHFGFMQPPFGLGGKFIAFYLGSSDADGKSAVHAVAQGCLWSSCGSKTVDDHCLLAQAVDQA